MQIITSGCKLKKNASWETFILKTPQSAKPGQWRHIFIGWEKNSSYTPCIPVENPISKLLGSSASFSALFNEKEKVRDKGSQTNLTNYYTSVVFVVTSRNKWGHMKSFFGKSLSPNNKHVFQIHFVQTWATLIVSENQDFLSHHWPKIRLWNLVLGRETHFPQFSVHGAE